MSIEDRLTRALAEEAETIDVDVEHLRARTRDQLAAAGVPERARRRTSSGPLLFAAAASVAIAATAATLLTTGWVDRTAGPQRGGVDLTFSCPVQRDIDVTSGAQDEFLPRLGPGGPAAVADEYDAPRWDFVEEGDRATLRLGNDDGSLGSITTYRAVGDGGWTPVSAVACGSGDTPGVPTRDELRLGTHGYPPYESWMSPRYYDGASVFLDDRAVYDYSGLVTRHRSMYVAPCDNGRLCWETGNPTGMVTARLRADVPTIAQDASDLFFEPDDLVGRDNPFGMWAAWDPDGTVRALRAGLEGGRVRESQTFTDSSWGDGVLHVLVAPRASTRWVEAETSDGEVVRHAPEDVTGYEPDTGE